MDVRELKDSAADFFRKGKFAKAAEAYLALSKAEPKETQHLIKLGDSFRRDGRKEPAIEAYRRAVDEYARQGIVIKAIAACKLILEIDSSQKDAQEQLANLCAKRYVRRDQVETPPQEQFGQPYGQRSYPDAIELPDEDAPVELETLGAPMPSSRPPVRPHARSLPPIAKPPSRPPAAPARTPPSVPPVMHAQRSGEPDVNEAAVLNAFARPPARAAVPPAFARPSSSPKAPEPEAIELDLDLGGPVESSVTEPPGRRRGQAIDLAADADQDAIEELPADALEPEDDFVSAENTEEHRVLRTAEAAADAPVTAMATILADSLLVTEEQDGDDDDEEELFSVTAGQTTPAPGAIALAPPSPAAEEITDEQVAEARHLANELAFDPSDDAGLVPPEPPAREPTQRPRPPPPPAMPLSDVDQRSVPLFSELPKEAFVELLEKLHFRRYAPGDVIVREAEAGQSIYVLASGSAKVVKGFGTSKALDLAELKDGAFFGEMALLTGAPRVASVVATDDCEVLEITEGLLRDLTMRHPSVAQSLKKFYRQRLLANVMAISPLFRAFDRSDRKMLVEKFKLREVKPGEAVITEGERPDGLYVVMHGTALVSKKDAANARSMPLAVLKEGDVFGEMSLLTKKPATATVTAKRRTLVLRLPKPVFDELMFTHPQVLEVVSELTDQRTRVNEQILSGQVDAPLEALALV